MRATYRHKNRLVSEINVVPYIDVMLVLLIVFMITAPLFSTGVEIELPEANSAPLTEQSAEPFVVTVDADGQYYLNDNTEPVASPDEIEQTARRVLQENPDLPFLVRGDGAVAYAMVVDAMVLLQRAGVASIGLITEPPPPEPAESP